MIDNLIFSAILEPLGRYPKKEIKMNKQDKAKISQIINDLYSGVAIALDPTNAKDKLILSNLRGDIATLREALELK